MSVTLSMVLSWLVPMAIIFAVAWGVSRLVGLNRIACIAASYLLLAYLMNYMFVGNSVVMPITFAVSFLMLVPAFVALTVWTIVANQRHGAVNG